MRHLGLTKTELAAFHRCLTTSHTRVIDVDVQTLDRKSIASITPVVLDGQILVDLDAEVTRKLVMTFLDPSHAMQFDSRSPTDGALYRDRIIEIGYRVFVPELGRHVTATPFHGPVTRFARDGALVSIEADGRERLALGEAWQPLTLKKKTRKVTAIRRILADRAGETRFNLPEVKTTMPKGLSLGRLQKPWEAARRLARSMNRQLFYTGPGVATLRRWPSKPVFTFTDGPGGTLLSDPEVATGLDSFRNIVWLRGGKPKGAKKRVAAVAVAPPNHPLSPRSLAVNGVPFRSVEEVENPQIKTTAEARRRAERILEDRLRGIVEVAFDSLPIPHLDEGDVIRVATRGATVKARLRTFSIPLSTEGDPVMTVGYLKRTTPVRKKIRRRR